MTKAGGDFGLDRVKATYLRSDADILVALDVPPALDSSRNDRLQRYSRTLRNLEALVMELGEQRIAPVVHGRSIEEVAQNAVLIRSVSSSPKIICIGGLVPLLRRSGSNASDLSKSIGFVIESIAAVRSEFPGTPVHVLGAGAPRTVLAALAFGADSTDSIAWRRAAGFGTVFTPGKGERFVERRLRLRPRSRPFLSPNDIQDCECPVCERKTNRRAWAALAACYRARAAHNAWILLQEVREFEAARASGRLLSHLQSRLPPAWLKDWYACPNPRRHSTTNHAATGQAAVTRAYTTEPNLRASI
jgi:tRNA-guanine family transglycosylase